MYLVKQMYVRVVPVDYQMIIVSPAQDRNVRFVVLSLYCHPETNVKTFLRGMEKLLFEIPTNLKAVVMEDFNIDIFNKTRTTEKVLNLFRYYGFRQLCKIPIHGRGGLIDHFYTNNHSDDVILSYHSRVYYILYRYCREAENDSE